MSEPKLNSKQRQEVNRLMEEAQDDLEGVLFRLVATLTDERKDHTERMNSVQDFYSRQLAAESGKSHWLGELLAVIHCDGGHYQSEHGTEKSTKDAIKKRTEMVMRIDELETQLADEREKVQPLMNVLKEIKGLCGMPSERRGKSGMRLVKILNVTVAGLEKVKEGK